MKSDFDKLGKKHQDIFDNTEVNAVATWRQKNFDDATDDATYLAGAIKNIRSLKDKVNSVLNNIKSE